MTFSIVARCSHTNQFGVGAATAMPAVGKLVSYAQAGCGGAATQARINPYLGIDGLRMLAEGMTAQDALDRLCGGDPRIEARQFALVDHTGGVAAWTGSECIEWAGSVQGDGFSIQGNRLAGPQVLEAAKHAMEENAGRSLADRLLAALVAGDAEGGDTKGERSATIYVVDTEEYPLWDIRVDDHPRPIIELQRLHKVFAEDLLPQFAVMPTRANPAGKPEGEANA